MTVPPWSVWRGARRRLLPAVLGIKLIFGQRQIYIACSLIRSKNAVDELFRSAGHRSAQALSTFAITTLDEFDLVADCRVCHHF